MDALQLLLCSLMLYFFAGIASLFLYGLDRIAIKISGIASLAGGLVGIVSALTQLHSAIPLVTEFITPFPFATLTIRMDSLSAFMLLVISVLVAVCALYSLAYMREYLGKGAAAIGFFMNMFIASMVSLLVMDNAFWFIVFFEMMSLASWFLVIAAQDKESIRAGMLYFFIAHAGSVLIMIAFFLMWRECHSLDFASFRTLPLSPGLASAVFLLGFFGFGAKAGMLPLHSWLPLAHPAAPSHASALMSGVMVKIGIFGILKVSIDLLGNSGLQLWWGVVVIIFGAVSALLGVLYALAENDIKRLLAWSTVENVGIILLGVGVSMVGLSLQLPVIATVGLLAALFHLLNHAMFKGLLFLGAGAVIGRLHTRDMEKMGALAKRMPRTAAAFLIGCVAISALPPFNGFISEWYTYQSLFAMTHFDAVTLRLLGPVAIVMLAVTGALAAMCFVKLYGISFCGAPRSSAAEEAHEAPWQMTVSLLILAALCILLGVGARWVAPHILQVVFSFTHLTSLPVAESFALLPGTSDATLLTPSALFLLLITVPLIPALYWWLTRSHRAAFRRSGDAWACGYGWESAMAPSASGVMQPMRVFLSSLYRLRKQLDPSASLACGLQHVTEGARRTEPFWDDYLIRPVVNVIQRIALRVQQLQSGDFRLYCLYVVVALVVLLIAIAL
ncbi:hydrogenase 4 subunit B [Escherichia fergusonii]|uniref:hydrogenase 4 subunit B n=1 Tax=Escherichia fergusonii TaxID=564 RepID=UPI0001FB5278|nr:hydrogenase 4 subunit B [Escherichia fergusonii]EGC06949.1 NADH-Ubiquinone/plastoquinone [Escherichia fergusonii B253]